MARLRHRKALSSVGLSGHGERMERMHWQGSHHVDILCAIHRIQIYYTMCSYHHWRPVRRSRCSRRTRIDRTTRWTQNSLHEFRRPPVRGSRTSVRSDSPLAFSVGCTATLDGRLNTSSQGCAHSFTFFRSAIWTPSRVRASHAGGEYHSGLFAKYSKTETTCFVLAIYRPSRRDPHTLPIDT
jgi:hypothetical protein